MRASGNDRSPCQEARPYYYELLCHDEAAVPEAVVRHVAGCSFCREQIRRLQDTFRPGDTLVPAAEMASNDVAIEALDRHFEFLGASVRCSHVRPFLPELLPVGPDIRIPTPITVHVENCPECTDDLAAIRSLELTAGQLQRLSRFYDESACYHPSICDQARAARTALARFVLDETDPEALDHVSRCPECREWVYRQRAQVAAHLHAEPVRDDVLRCGEIATADLFDFIVPFGLDAAALGRADGRRDAVSTHLHNCPDCLERVQSLHQTIYGIAERADSALCTIYRCQDDSESPACRYPVNVQILRDETALASHCGESSTECCPSGRGFRVGLGKKVPVRSLLLVIGVALLAASVAFQTRIAAGTSVDDLVAALESVPNVYMRSWKEDSPQQVYEMWSSQELRKSATRSGGTCTMYDLDEGLVTLIGPGGSQRRRLSPQEADRCAGFISGFVRDLFKVAQVEGEFAPSAAGSPAAADGQPITCEIVKEGRTTSGQKVSHRLRVSFHPVLRLPERIEYRFEDSADLARTPDRITTFTYPTTAKIADQIAALRQPE